MTLQACPQSPSRPPGAGHCPQWSRPDLVTDLLCSIIKGTWHSQRVNVCPLSCQLRLRLLPQQGCGSNICLLLRLVCLRLLPQLLRQQTRRTIGNISHCRPPSISEDRPRRSLRRRRHGRSERPNGKPSRGPRLRAGPPTRSRPAHHARPGQYRAGGLSRVDAKCRGRAHSSESCSFGEGEDCWLVKSQPRQIPASPLIGATYWAAAAASRRLSDQPTMASTPRTRMTVVIRRHTSMRAR